MAGHGGNLRETHLALLSLFCGLGARAYLLKCHPHQLSKVVLNESSI